MMKIFIFHQSLPILIYSFLKYCLPVNKIISNSFCPSSTFQNRDCASGPLNTVTLWDHGNMPSVAAPTSGTIYHTHPYKEETLSPGVPETFENLAWIPGLGWCFMISVRLLLCFIAFVVYWIILVY